MQVFINNNARSVVKAKKKYCKYEAKKIKTESLIDDDLEKGSSHESGSEFDNDSNDDKDNDESNE